MNLILIGEETPDRGDDRIKRLAIASYTKMMQEILFNIHLVKNAIYETYIKDMSPPAYEDYKNLLIVLKDMAAKHGTD
jgi:hypothetical protein